MKKFLISFVVFSLAVSINLIQAQSFTTYTTTDGLPDNFCSGGVAVDDSNHVWVGTALGLAKFDGTTWTSYTTTDGLVDNYIVCVETDGNDVWVGTNMGLSKFDGSTWTTYTMTDGLSDNTIMYVYADASHNIWAATGIGLNMFDGATWTTFTTSNGLLGEDIKYITQSTSGTVWTGYLGGYSEYLAPSAFTSYSIAIIDSLASDNVFAIAVEDNGNKWVGTWNGISVIDTDDNWLSNYRISDGLYNNFVQDIKIAPNGDIWVGCFASYNGDGGVSYFNGSAWTSYTTSNGLADMQVVRLDPDQSGNIWVATGNGLTKISGVSGINDEENIKISISPNPATDFVSITTDETPSQISILNSTGQVVKTINPVSAQTNIATNQLPSGVYFVLVNSNNRIITRKFIIE